MPGSGSIGLSSHVRPWLPALLAGASVALVTLNPALLRPIAHIVAALCDRYGVLALLMDRVPLLPLTLLLCLSAVAACASGWTGMTSLLATLRFNRLLHQSGTVVPHRVADIADELGLTPRLTYVSWPEPMACCYGLVWPRIVITAGLAERLDDEELMAVLGHEWMHLCRRDPLRYLVADVLSAAAFMFPIAPYLRERWRTRSELAADQAALAVASRGALAGALLAVIRPAQFPSGIAGLNSTEARIAQLSGQSALPPLPARAMVVSLGLAAGFLLAFLDLSSVADMGRLMCPYCF